MNRILCLWWTLLFFTTLFSLGKCSDTGYAYVSDDEESDDSKSILHPVGKEKKDPVDELTDAFKNAEFFKPVQPKAPSMAGTPSPLPTNPFQMSSPLSCRDMNGDGVDWWFIYKENNGSRYLYYSSAHVMRGDSQPQYLLDGYLVTDYHKSPLLRTIYQNYNIDDKSIWFAWNDQSADGLDAFGGKIDNVKHAHAKGFFSIKATTNAQNQNEVDLSSYAILHSLPRFPNIPQTREAWLDQEPKIFKRFLPLDPSQIFASNVADNAQHFMCISLQHSKAPYVNNEIQYDPSSPTQPAHVHFLQKYLRTIHPAIVATNFDDRNSSLFFWRQYFSLFRLQFSEAHRYFEPSVPLHHRWHAYSINDLPSEQPTGPERILFPLSDTRLLANGRLSASARQSRWSALCASKNGCKTGDEEACLAEAVITSTGFQDQITIKLLAKHGLSLIDMYDDWATLQLSELQTRFKRNYSDQVPPRHGMLVQTWQDSGTLPKKPSKKIYNEQGYTMATVHIDNVGTVTFPYWNYTSFGYNYSTKRIEGEKKDHSKWLIGFTLDSFNGDLPAHHDRAKFVPLFCVGDLNRTKTQTQLSGKSQGRGGGLFCTTHRALWKVMIDLKPSAAVKSRNNLKSEAVMVQNRLRRLCATPFVNHQDDPIHLAPFRNGFFKFLRIKKDSSNENKSVDFVTFLSELSDFLVRARNETEKKVFYAFEQFYKLASVGKISGAAEWVWETISRRRLEKEAVPILRKLPPLVLDRHEPENINSPDKKVLVHFKETDRFGLIDEDSEEFIEHMRRQLGPLSRHAETQTEPEMFHILTDPEEDENTETETEEDGLYSETNEDPKENDIVGSAEKQLDLATVVASDKGANSEATSNEANGRSNVGSQNSSNK